MNPLPRLYAIVDAAFFSNTEILLQFCQELHAGGVTLLQYRNKSGNSRLMLDQSRRMKLLLGNSVKLIMNDRADLALAADFEGVHLGQDDLSPASVRRVIGDDLWLGVSTHNPEQLSAADRSSATYLAIGPVFGPAAKKSPIR